jgi:hypothetical protein
MICEQVARHPGAELHTPALIRASSAPALPGTLHAVVFKSLYWCDTHEDKPAVLESARDMCEGAPQYELEVQLKVRGLATLELRYYIVVLLVHGNISLVPHQSHYNGGDTRHATLQGTGIAGPAYGDRNPPTHGVAPMTSTRCAARTIQATARPATPCPRRQQLP